MINTQIWFDQAKALGIDALELYEGYHEQARLTWFEQAMDTNVISQVSTLSIRAQVKDKLLETSLEAYSDEECELILKDLLKSAPYVNRKGRLPEASQGTDLAGPNMPKASADEVKAFLAKLEAAILAYDKRIVQVGYLGYEYNDDRRTISSSREVNVHDESRVAYVVAEVVASEKDVIKNGDDIRLVEDIHQFDIDDFVQKLCDPVLFRLKEDSMASGNYPVIFHRDAARSLVGAFMSLFSGELVYKEISILHDKMDQKIFSDKITLVNNPKLQSLLEPVGYDDEGVPTQELILVDQGRLCAFLHDTRSADECSTISTGNHFNGTSSPYGTYIVPGERDLEALQKKMDTGLVIEELAGLHAGINSTTTDFSLQCKGYWVEEGQKVRPITLVTVAANYLELMNKLVEVGSDLEWEYHTLAVPSLYFEEVAISGQASD